MFCSDLRKCVSGLNDIINKGNTKEGKYAKKNHDWLTMFHVRIKWY